MAESDGKLIIENARILFRNFSGKEGKYNREGDRNFCVLLEDPDQTRKMIEDGWNVKFLRARDEGDEDQPYIQVSVNFRGKPPTCVLIGSRGRTTIMEDMVEALDWVEIAKTDLIINPYHWDVNGAQGIKAYLRSIYITVAEDYLELKYSDVPEADNRTLGSVPEPKALGAGQTIIEDEDIIDAELVED